MSSIEHMSGRGCRLVAVLLACVLFLGPVAGPLVAAEKIVPTKLTRHVRYSGTGWGWITPLLFAGTRGVEALQMDGASGAERLDHATKWAKNPRFWAAVGSDILAVKAAESLVTFLPVPAYFKAALVCLAGFGVFEGVYGGFDQVDWGTLIVQSLALTAVEMAMASFGFGGLAIFAASFGVCMLMDAWTGFDGSEDDDEAYQTDESKTAEAQVAYDPSVLVAPSYPESSASEGEGTRVSAFESASLSAVEVAANRDEAYRTMIASLRSGQGADGREALENYRRASAAMVGRRQAAYR